MYININQIISDSTEYVIKPLSLNYSNIAEVSRFVVEGNNDDELLYLGLIPKSELKFDTPEFTFNTIERYFNNSYYNFIFANDLDIDVGKYRDVEDFAKLLWLTEEFLNNDFKFKYPITVHWNPRIQANVIHPGGSRNQVIRMFGKDKIDALYFNTGSVSPEWLTDNMEVTTFGDVAVMGGAIKVVADHGSLIPHVHFNQELIKHSVSVYQNKIRSLFKSGFGIETNATEPIFKSFKTATPNITIKFNDDYTIEDVNKAILLSMLGYSVESSNFVILKNDRLVLKI